MAPIALPLRFVFGAVAFEISLNDAAHAEWTLPAAYEPYLLAASASSQTESPVFARVVCSLQRDPSLKGVLQPEGAAYWQTLPNRAGGLHVRGDEVAFDMQRVADFDLRASFVVQARVAAAVGLPQVLLLMAAAAVELAGGLCLHATAVEFEGSAVLLLGPSGAGKSTAAQQLAPLLYLANDRVMVVPKPLPLAAASDTAANAPAAYAVWALPVGNAPRLERHRSVVLPLGALLRIIQAPRTALRDVSRAQATLYIREAADVAAESGFFEAQRLEAVTAVAMAAPSGIADILLGDDWRAALSAFMSPTHARNSGVHG
ncbi:MAG: HPr Serine kinase C-terminal domain [Pseudomonadota bacterium]